MKFKITFKDSDCVTNALIGLLINKYYTDISCDEAMQDRKDELILFLRQWVKYTDSNEDENNFAYLQYIDIEFDTEANTATVIKREKVKDTSQLPF